MDEGRRLCVKKLPLWSVSLSGFWLHLQDPLDPTRTVIVVQSLVAGGVAEESGQILPGDRLLFVNDSFMDNASLDDAVQTLTSVPPGKVRIGLCKPLVVRFEKQPLFH